ncbi:hypothetical protein CLV81_2251 [Flagellimonas meridianipacifica]|uniref:Uncharacterized protein n=1 Tax=Flagellimonas meridianipacifica TaxID=1080225 RepID=A0A2T0M8N1_9FLAO|nr:hypothetical protein CLV81_2251 [Allomuricauda pacifica]
MMAYFTYKMNRVVVYCNLIYFAIGTLLFLLLLIKQSDFLIGLSMVFFVLASIVNALMLLLVFANTLLNPKDIEQHFLAFVIALFNYPIAILFIHFLT